MRASLLLILFIFITSCTNNSGPAGVSPSDKKKIREEVISIAENYASNQLKVTSKKITGTGIIIIGDQQKRYIIDPSKIFVGLIDNDEKQDAIVTIVSFQGENLDMIEHLIILNTNDKLMILRSIESDMKILQVKDRVITAELPTKPRSSPLYNCASCQEIVRFHLVNGELARVE
jgi:hypothetical protein